MESGGPEGQLGNSGFSLGSENSVQLELSPRSLDRAAAVTNRLWPKLLNPSGHLPLPPGLPEPGQEEQTPRLNLELDGPPPGQRAQFSLSSLRPLWLLEPLSQDLPPPPTPSHRSPSVLEHTGPFPGDQLQPMSAQAPEEALSLQSWMGEGLGAVVLNFQVGPRGPGTLGKGPQTWHCLPVSKV